MIVYSRFLKKKDAKNIINFDKKSCFPPAEGWDKYVEQTICMCQSQ